MDRYFAVAMLLYAMARELNPLSVEEVDTAARIGRPRKLR
jgi:hypothetical protein